MEKSYITFKERQVYFHCINSGDLFSSFLPVLVIDQTLDEPEQKIRVLEDYHYFNEIICNNFSRCNGFMNKDSGGSNKYQVINKNHDINVATILDGTTSSSTRTEQTSNTFSRFGSSLTSLSDSDDSERRPQKIAIPSTAKLDDINAKWLVDIFFGINT